MADIDEVKSLFEATQQVAHAAKQKAEELEGKSADYLDKATMDNIKADLAGKISEQDAAQIALKSRLDEIETKLNRPNAAGKDKTQESKAFGDYMRKGIEADELKAMSTTTGDSGGFLIPDQLREGIQARLRRSSPVRQVASVVTLEGMSYNVLTERGDAGYEWAGEKSTRNETDTPTINRISITAHELSAMPKVSQRMLDDVGFDLEGWLQARVEDRFGRAEATAFVAGSGIDKPKGFLTYSTATTDDATRAAESLQYRGTGTSGAFDATAPADVLVKTFYDLQGAYQSNASWMMKNATMADVAVMKDGDGTYLMREILNGDGTLVRTIMGRQAYVADDMPTVAANSLSIAVGDFAAGYTIVEGTSMTVLRDPFTAKPHVLFYVTKRVGGGVTDFDAIKLIKFA
ncbi:phage major capsid protein [Roseobacter sp. TSBP12]|uniref:phage major capsid protein n=1 Tax=Roseobacter sp. TSBP12 TaxID=1236613 RepID=UPI00125FD9BC|nr:phage major capsid protein [Roseobacter sp. TSBP12]KAB6714323.1 phage major capsid protein [Roseobacter sp. TSBP12]